MTLKRKHENGENKAEDPKSKILKPSLHVNIKSKKFVDKNKKFKKLVKPGTNTKNEASATGTGEKADWKKLKAEKKQLREKRKQQKSYYSSSIEMKKLYEALKCKSTKSNKEELAKKLYEYMKNNVRTFVMAHDVTRIVQCVLKKADSSVRKQLSEELVPLTVEMATSKYAHFCVLRMLNYGDKDTKKKVVENLFGSICKLTLNNISNSIIDIVYTTHANKTQKYFMKQELYGDIYKKSKDLNVTKLSDTYKDSPQLKTAILSAVKGNLEQLANKNVVDNSLVHAVLNEYLEECEKEDFDEILNIFSSKIPLLLTTRDGSKASILMFWKASTKDRRAMVKSVKEHLIKICTHEHGHTFLISVINCMDDTKAIKKQIFDPLSSKFNEVVKNQWGQKVIEWFIEPASKKHFHPELIRFYETGLQYGKKPFDIRRKEILEQIEETLCEEICKDTSFWLSDMHIGALTSTILKNLSVNYFCKTAETIAKYITNLSSEVAKEKSNVVADVDSNASIEDLGLHITLTKMIKNDKLRLAANEENTLGEYIVKNLTSNLINLWIGTNRACFILVNILENCKDEVKNVLSSMISSNLKALQSQNHVAAGILIKKIKLH